MGNPNTANAYNHVFTLAFSMNSSTEDGSDISGAAFRRALEQRLAELTDDDEIGNAVFPPEETTCTDADGNTRHIRSMPIHSHLEMEAALCVWEFMEAASNHDHRLRIEALADLRDRIGSVELRHASIAIGRYCLKVYDLIPKEARQGHAYDWEIIPAIVATINFPSLEPTLPPAEAAARVIAQLKTPPPAPPAPVMPPIAVAEADDDDQPTVASEFDIRCPGCGSDEHMQVELKTLAHLTPDGTDPGPEHDWHNDSFIHCDNCDWEGKVAQCRADAIAAARADVPSTPTKRIMAEFVPQAWLNDHAIAVDPAGDTMFDVTDDILKLGRERALQLRDDQHETDHLRHAATAPQWVKDWSGPFVVNVEKAIESYFTEMDATQQQTNESNAQ